MNGKAGKGLFQINRLGAPVVVHLPGVLQEFHTLQTQMEFRPIHIWRSDGNVSVCAWHIHLAALHQGPGKVRATALPVI